MVPALAPAPTLISTSGVRKEQTRHHLQRGGHGRCRGVRRNRCERVKVHAVHMNLEAMSKATVGTCDGTRRATPGRDVSIARRADRAPPCCVGAPEAPVVFDEAAVDGATAEEAEAAAAVVDEAAEAAAPAVAPAVLLLPPPPPAAAATEREGMDGDDRPLPLVRPDDNPGTASPSPLPKPRAPRLAVPVGVSAPLPCTDGRLSFGGDRCDVAVTGEPRGSAIVVVTCAVDGLAARAVDTLRCDAGAWACGSAAPAPTVTVISCRGVSVRACGTVGGV